MGDARLARQLPGQLQFFAVGMALYLYGERLRVHPLVSAAIAVGFLAMWTMVEPIPPGIRPLVVGCLRVQLRTVHAGGRGCGRICRTASIWCMARWCRP